MVAMETTFLPFCSLSFALSKVMTTMGIEQSVKVFTVIHHMLQTYSPVNGLKTRFLFCLNCRASNFPFVTSVFFHITNLSVIPYSR